MAPLGIKFDGVSFSHEFVARRARRWLKKMLDGIGGVNSVVFCIHNEKNLVDYLPPEVRYKYKKAAEANQEVTEMFSNEDVYSWIPDEYKAVIEEEPGGREWVNQQIALIRMFFIPT